MKLLLLSFFTVFLVSCSLSEDTPDTGELEAYQLTFLRISRQDTTDYEDRDFQVISVVDNNIILTPDYDIENHDGAEDHLEAVEEEALVNISLEDNTFYIEGEESEFTFTPSSRTVYALDNGTRYQLYVLQDGQDIGENPFYTEK